MKRIFISDLHLDAHREDLTRGFLHFLDTAVPGADELYILGDFFEVWLGDDDDSAFNRRIIDALAALPCQVHVMHGNRDFLLGEEFCTRTGAKLLKDPTLVNLGDRQALLMHGDSLCTRDEEYMKARALLRSDAFQNDFLSKSIEERAAVARQIRGESAEMSREKTEDIMDVTPSEVIRVMEEAGVDLLIHGHTHRPAEHDVELASGAGQRIVLGDWQPSTWFIEADDASISFRQFVP